MNEMYVQENNTLTSICDRVCHNLLNDTILVLCTPSSYFKAPCSKWLQ